MGTASTRAETAGWVVASLLLLALGWWSTPAPVPLYDGIGFPDEPYRYVIAPPGARATAAPTRAVGRFDLIHGSNRFAELASDENGPQVSLYLPDDAMSADQDASTITLQAVPRAPDTEPDDATIDGNVYVVTAASDAGHVTFTTGGTAADITLREPALRAVLPVVECRADPRDRWHRLRTEQAGQDIFRAPMQRAGEYALAVPKAGTAGQKAGTTPARGGGSGTGALTLLLGGTVGLMALTVAWLRVRAARQRAAGGARRPSRAEPSRAGEPNRTGGPNGAARPDRHRGQGGDARPDGRSGAADESTGRPREDG